MLRAKFGITLERTVRELNGISCVEMEEAEHQKASSVPAALKAN